MPQKPIDEIVKAYWEHYSSTQSSDRVLRLDAERTLWAWEAVEEEVRSPTARVLKLLLALGHEAKDDDALAYLGAGPVEDLISWHGARYLDEIDQCARSDPAFRKALSNVWIATQVPEAVHERLAKYIKTRGSSP